MAKSVKRILCIVLLCCLAITILPYSQVEAASASSEIKTGIGYTFLKNDTQRKAYMQLAQDAAELRPIIRYDSNSSELGTWEDVVFVLDMFYADFPEFYWVGNEYGGSDLKGQYGDAYGVIVPAYSREFLTEYERFNRKVFEIVESIPRGYDSGEEIVRYLWNYVKTNVTYATEHMGQTAYTALVKGEALCYGYARALSCLLKKAGISSMPVTGIYHGGPHAWNVVWIDGMCYYIDPTNDEAFASFCSFEEMVQKGYVLDSSFSAILPATCNHHRDEIFYNIPTPVFSYVIADDTTPLEKVASRFFAYLETDSPSIFQCCIDYRGSNLDSWWQASREELCQLLGVVNSFSASCHVYDVGDEFYGFAIEGALPHITIAGTVDVNHYYPVYEIITTESEVLFTSEFQSCDLSPKILPSYASIKEFTCTSSDPSIAQVDSNGVIVPVSNGTATITISADGVTSTCRVTVSLQPHVCETPLRYVSAGAPDCYNNGNKAYYICDHCGEWFEDAHANRIIQNKTQFTVPAIGHIFPENWSSDDYYHFKHCSRCWGVWSIGGTISAEHSDTNGDGACDVCGYGAQSTTTPSVTEPNQTTPTQKPTNSTTTTPSNPTSPPTTPPTQQTSPSDTTDSSATTTPSSPTNPTDSTAPSVPTSQPTIPSNPTESPSSGNPSNPSIESTPETSATPSGTTTSGNPEPGNDDHPNSTWIIYVALLLGVGGIISYLIYKRKVKSS